MAKHEREVAQKGPHQGGPHGGDQRLHGAHEYHVDGVPADHSSGKGTCRKQETMRRGGEAILANQLIDSARQTNTGRGENDDKR